MIREPFMRYDTFSIAWSTNQLELGKVKDKGIGKGRGKGKVSGVGIGEDIGIGKCNLRMGKVKGIGKSISIGKDIGKGIGVTLCNVAERIKITSSAQINGEYDIYLTRGICYSAKFKRVYMKHIEVVLPYFQKQ